MERLSEQVKMSTAVTVTEGAAEKTAINGATIDMAGFDGVLVHVCMGAIVTGAATSIKAQQGEAADLSDAADIAGTSQTIADDADEKHFWMDVMPTERYFRLVVSRATQNATVASAEYYQYRASRSPVSTHGTNWSGERQSTTTEGTA